MGIILLDHDQFAGEAELPMIDIASLSSHDDETAEVRKLVMAAKEWGFLQITNHNVSDWLLSAVDEQLCRVFHLPLETKLRAEPAPGNFHGYLAKSSGENGKRPRVSEAFRFPLDPQLRSDLILKLWPEGNETLSAVLEEYIAAMDSILLQLLKSLATGLGLDPLQFTQDLSRNGHSSMLRMNFYDASSQPSPTLAFPVHSDPQLLTILHQNDVVGLQILKDNKWIAIRPQPGSFLVNVGDTLQVMSNDLYPSVVHRVLMNSNKFRSSIAYALATNPQTIVRPIAQLVTEQQPSKYRPFTPEEYYTTLKTVGYNDGKANLERFRPIPTLG